MGGRMLDWASSGGDGVFCWECFFVLVLVLCWEVGTGELEMGCYRWMGRHTGALSWWMVAQA